MDEFLSDSKENAIFRIRVCIFPTRYYYIHTHVLHIHMRIIQLSKYTE